MMNVSLRKANVLQNAINDALKSIDAVTSVKINEFQDAEAEIKRVAEVFCTNLSRRDALTNTLYEIRKAVSGANAKAGIDNRLADVAHLDKNIQFYSLLAGKPVRENERVLAGRLDKIRNNPTESRRTIYGYDDSVETSVLTKEDLDNLRRRVAAAKKQKQKLQDEILELNVRTEITLSDTAYATLQAEGLI